MTGPPNVAGPPGKNFPFIPSFSTSLDMLCDVFVMKLHKLTYVWLHSQMLLSRKMILKWNTF